MIAIRWVLMVCFCASLMAQNDPAPVPDAAKKAFDAMATAVWRPRDHGLEEIRFQFELEVVHQDRPAEKHGPFKFHWQKDQGWRLLDAEGKVDPKPEARINPAFADRVVNDLVGWNTADMIMGRKLSLPRPGVLQVEINHAEPAEELRVERILRELDEDGALKTQSLIGTDNILMNRLSYRYETISGRRLVVKVRSEAGGSRLIKEQSYQNVAGFSFPSEIRSLNESRRVDVIRYSEIEVLNPKELKK